MQFVQFLFWFLYFFVKFTKFSHHVHNLFIIGWYTLNTVKEEIRLPDNKAYKINFFIIAQMPLVSGHSSFQRFFQMAEHHLFFYIFSICQSIGSTPFACKNSFALLKCLHPKNPRYADSGLGCGAVKIRCFGLVSIGILLCAGLPHSMYTIGLSCAFTAWMIASVNCSQPCP